MRMESVLLGFVQTEEDRTAIKMRSVRSNTRTVYQRDDDDQWVAWHPEVHRIADEIEARFIAKKKKSGFEREYARVVRLYFGDMERHLAGLRAVLRPGAQLAYVVGDQASFFQVPIPTGQLLRETAEHLGYQVTSIEVFRTRRATRTREELNEEIVTLRWPAAIAELEAARVQVVSAAEYSDAPFLVGVGEADAGPPSLFSARVSTGAQECRGK
jgi:hypothetical protein